MRARSSSISSSSWARPRRVSRCSCMSRMYSAWTSLNSNGAAWSASRAAALSSEARMVVMISSIRSSALSRPSTMWARSWAFFSRYSDRRVMTSTWCCR